MITVELDLDGVVGDIFNALEAVIKPKYPNFCIQNQITYNGKHADLGCPRVVMLKEICNPEIYNLISPYSEAIKLLRALLSVDDINVVINSDCCGSKELAKTKAVWLEDLQKLVNGKNKFNYILDTSLGIKRMCEDSDVIIEDCLDNISRSNADIKILVNQHHNKLENNQEYRDLFNELHLVETSNYREILEIIESYYPGVLTNEILRY